MRKYYWTTIKRSFLYCSPFCSRYSKVAISKAVALNLFVLFFLWFLCFGAWIILYIALNISILFKLLQQQKFLIFFALKEVAKSNRKLFAIASEITIVAITLERAIKKRTYIKNKIKSDNCTKEEH